ncbi:dihydrolipoamide acetyltransferase family protein [Noviherbaspirillum pedocola]|uniref:Dihydrolipoamide acetyltransferase component of pyruvate dehydrogenase complex n=1 Tax=Noviherbaspirillum pedocola TaxID=2801341 RepID=A0A934W7L7_9BURK|nr:dihydrolipoamide acetyltransferase family protein [Noviherbaspirillum pedocola]MBK4737592.1 2-oxo acid dehydrogenase subunit E2 [Noviherbaspirillum pedocola]
MIEFKLPSLGSDMDSGKLLRWQVKPGDMVRRGQIVAVVDTSKAAVDVESWQEGKVFELLAQPGETLPVGTVLATLLEEGETPETVRRPAPEQPSAPAGAARATQVGAPPPVAGAATAPLPAAGRRRTSPAARRLAEEHGIDLETVAGTGPDEAVTLQDVQRAIEAPQAARASGVERQAEMRRAIAAAMSRSKREIPHYYLSETVPLRRAQEWLLEANRQRDIGTRLLMAVLQLKAVALTLKQYPELNGFFIDGARRASEAVHVGVAIALRQGGLIAPALHDVERRSLDELMRDLADLVQRARAGSLRSSEMSDPTVTVTNLGDGGVEAVHGVIYPPQVALVGFGRIHERPWAEDGALRSLPAVVATLAADHRVSDGHYGAMFLAALRERLQRPETL